MNELVPVNNDPKDPTVWYAEVPRSINRLIVIGVVLLVVCFGGFGLIENPTDLWSTRDGSAWTLSSEPVWNAATPDEVKYDFDSIVVDQPEGPVVLTFGGDRETFDFEDPENYLRVDDDVWRFGPPKP